MTVTSTYARQPTKFDYASPTQFKFQLTKLPKVEYFCTAANIPGISIPSPAQPTPLADIPLPGDTISFDNLSVTFLSHEHNSEVLWTQGKIDFQQVVKIVNLQTQVKLSMVQSH